MSSYQKISCEDHSIYELVIMRGYSMQVEIDGKVVRIKPTNISTKNGAEFLTFTGEDGRIQEIRADLVDIQK
ncbi:transcriptional antiterminator, Rof [Candidatus Thioglobus sp.]|uniref:transcriptional antiterminator, Rof n=1 Tax=Candidatus Thioglobus sp. TaxID=2026721 RepID=UPI002619443B|nr:transcriptional antiterminator, Rof [Candidatus Thioglobus sp.]MDG2395699.1 transcriptional antiterminator, Rof [Candidatus Thioglobus sp.]